MPALAIHDRANLLRRLAAVEANECAISFGLSPDYVAVGPPSGRMAPWFGTQTRPIGVPLRRRCSACPARSWCGRARIASTTSSFAAIQARLSARNPSNSRMVMPVEITASNGRRGPTMIRATRARSERLTKTSMAFSAIFSRRGEGMLPTCEPSRDGSFGFAVGSRSKETNCGRSAWPSAHRRKRPCPRSGRVDAC